MALPWAASRDPPRERTKGERPINDPQTGSHQERAKRRARRRRKTPELLLVPPGRRSPDERVDKEKGGWSSPQQSPPAGARAAVLVSNDHSIEQGKKYRTPLRPASRPISHSLLANDAAAAVQGGWARVGMTHLAVLRQRGGSSGQCWRFKLKKKVIISDRMQRGYVYWRIRAGRPELLAPGFTPDLTPKEMLRLGIFGGRVTGRIAGRSFHGAGSRAPGCAPSGMTRG